LIDEEKVKKQAELITRLEELPDSEVKRILVNMSHRMLLVDVFWEALELSINWVEGKEVNEDDQSRS